MALSNTCQIINNNAIKNTMQFLDKDIIIIYYYHQYYFMNKKQLLLLLPTHYTESIKRMMKAAS